MANAPENLPKEPGQERGSSGQGTGIGVAGSALATVSAVALFAAVGLEAPVIIGIVAGLGLLGGGLMALQHHKEKVNDAHVGKVYARTEGYHKEPEAVKDQSLIHLIKGRSDLPERVKYLEDHYGMKPVSAKEYRGQYMGTGLALGVVTGGLFLAGIAALTVGTFGMAGLALAGVTGALAGGTAFAAHSAHTMTRYDRYIDSLAEDGKAQQEQMAKAPAREYDNQRSRPGSYRGDVAASRQPANAGRTA